jgi:hypothetical protein
LIPPHTFPLSPANAKRLLILLAAYLIVVIGSAGAYILLSGDRRFPIHFAFLLVVISVCLWGIKAHRRWVWGLATLFSAWQIYSGFSNVVVLLNGHALHATPAKIIFGFVALRTAILLVLFMLLLFFSDRKKIYP